ncbi:MAG: T9SS type A sorting domain-containing protein [Candidatus Hydrogenedentota bacterium]
MVFVFSMVKRFILATLLIYFFILSQASYGDTYIFVRKWGSSGTGDGQFDRPSGIGMDKYGHVYISEYSNSHRCQKFTKNGNFILKWGSLGAGNGQFNYASGVVVDSAGYIHVVDRVNERVQKFTQDGSFVTIWGSGNLDLLFDHYAGIAIDSSSNIYVCRTDGSSISSVRKFNSSGGYILDIGSRGTAFGKFQDPHGVAVDDTGYVYVSDRKSGGSIRLQKFTVGGSTIMAIDTGGLNDPTGVAVDKYGYVYVCDKDNHRIKKYDSNGNIITVWGSNGAADGQFSSPEGIFVDSFGFVYVCDGGNSRIQVFALTDADSIPCSAPGSVIVSNPGYGGQLNLSWSNPPQPDFSYVMIYRSTASLSLGSLIYSNVTETSKIDTGLTNGETYYYTFFAVDTNGNWSIDTTQYSGTPYDTITPTEVTLLTPADGTPTSTVRPVFTYTNSLDSSNIEYILEIDDTYSFSSINYTGTSLTLSCSPSVDILNGTYYWRVRVKDIYNNSNQGIDSRMIVIDTAAPNEVSLISPVDGTCTNVVKPVFYYTASGDTSGIKWYILEIDDTSTFSSINYSGTSVSTSCSPSADMVNGTYYWRVRVLDILDQSNAGIDTNVIVIDTAGPNEVSLISPADGSSTNVVRPVFYYTASGDTSGIKWYILEIDDTYSFTSINYSGTSTTTSCSPTADMADNTYYWRVRVLDILDQSNVGIDTRVIRIVAETVPPTEVSLISPVDGACTNVVQPVFWYSASSDSSGIKWYILEIDDTSSFSSINYSGTSVSTSCSPSAEMVNGTYYWRVRVIDVWDISNTGIDSRVIVIDTAGPNEVSLISPADGSSTNVVKPVFYYTASGDTSGIKWYILEIDDTSSFASINYSGTSVSTSCSPSADMVNGTYYWRVRVLDILDQSNAGIDTRVIIIDTYISVSLVSPEDTYYTNDTTPRFVWSGSSVDTYTLEVDNDISFTSINYTVTTGDTEASADVLGEDTYYWRVIGFDKGGNWETTVARVIVIDTGLPAEVSLIAPENNTETNEQRPRLVWGSSSDSRSGVWYYQIELDNSSNFLSIEYSDTSDSCEWESDVDIAGDTYYWRVRVYDVAGNSNSGIDSRVIKIVADTLAPDEVSLISPADGSSTNVVQPVFWYSASSDSSGIKWYILEIDDTSSFASINYSGTSVSTSCSPSAEMVNGTYYWRVRVIDVWDISNTGIDSRVIVIDTAGPNEVSLISPADGSSTNVVKPVFYYTASGDTSGIKWYILEIDDTSSFASINYSGTSVSTSCSPSADMVNGTYYWRVRVLDILDQSNAGIDTRVIIIDTYISVSLVSPEDTYYTNDTTPRFVWSGSSVDTYTLEVDNDISFTSINYTVTTGDTEASADVLGEDTYYWRVIGFDKGGNWETTVARVIVIDTGLPAEVSLIAPENNTETNEQRPRLVWGSSSDSRSGVWYYQIELDNSSNFLSIEYSDTSDSCEWESDVDIAGDTYYWRVRVYDVAGNSNSGIDSRVIKIVADTLAPDEVSLISPADGSSTNVVQPVFWYSASSDSSGIKWYILEIDDTSSFASINYSGTSVSTSCSPSAEMVNGTYYWRVRVLDIWDQSNLGLDSNVLIIDTVPPVVYLNSIVINNDALVTNAETVTLSLLYDNSSIEMQISDTETFAGASFEPVSLTDTYVLTSIEGTKALWVRFKDAAGNISNSDSDTIVLDKTPPAGSVILDNGAAITTSQVVIASITVTETYQMIVSTDGVFDNEEWESKSDTKVINYGDTDGVKWVYVRFRDLAGNASDTCSDSITLAVPPLPVVNLSGTLLDGAKVRLDWLKSASNDVVKYYIYSDSTQGIINWSIPIDTVSAPTVTWTSDTLLADTYYLLGVRAVDNNGYTDEEYNAVRVMPRTSIDTNKPQTAIKKAKVYSGIYANIIAEVVVSSVNNISKVLFQYSVDTGATWVDMLQYNATNYPNPVFNCFDLAKYNTLWDISGLAQGEYLIRAVAYNLNNVPDTYAPGIWVEIGGDNSSSNPRDWPDEMGDTTTEGIRSRVKCYTTISNTLELAVPNRQSSIDQLNIANGLLNNEIDQLEIIFVDSSYYDTWIRAAQFVYANEIRKIELRSGQTQFTAGNVEFNISYQDQDLDGIVDGTTLREDDLKIYRLSNTDSKWYEISSQVDKTNKRVNGLTSQFSVFAVGAIPVASNLANVIVYPNPFRPNDGNWQTGVDYNGSAGSGIYITNLMASTEVEVYNVSGQKVYDFVTSANTGTVQWDAKDKNGRYLPSGVYIMLLKKGGDRKIVKFAIIR